MATKSHRAFSSNGNRTISPVVRAFQEAVQNDEKSPWEAMRSRILNIQKELPSGSPDQFLLACARHRNIVAVEEREHLSSEGFIEPLGSDPARGFRVVLRKEAPHSRKRFTLAHEICHTFFYEAAPELKRSATAADSMEECLCNYGASCLLIPEAEVKNAAAVHRPGLSSLEALCHAFQVSMEAMIVRLRELRIWKTELSLWHRMSDGSFAIDKSYGWDKIAWTWADPSIPEAAWLSGTIRRGETIFRWEDARGYSTAKSIHYEIRKYGMVLAVLCSSRKLRERTLPLFRSRTTGIAN